MSAIPHFLSTSLMQPPPPKKTAKTTNQIKNLTHKFHAFSVTCRTWKQRKLVNILKKSRYRLMIQAE